MTLRNNYTKEMFEKLMGEFFATARDNPSYKEMTPVDDHKLMLGNQAPMSKKSKVNWASYGVTPLHIAAYTGDLNKICEIREQKDLNVKTKTLSQLEQEKLPIPTIDQLKTEHIPIPTMGGVESMMGATPLLLAVLGGHIDVVQYLLSKKADPNVTTLSPLIVAVRVGNANIVEALVAAGAYRNAVWHGKTALQWVDEKKKSAKIKIIELKRAQENLISCLQSLKPPMMIRIRSFISSSSSMAAAQDSLADFICLEQNEDLSAAAQKLWDAVERDDLEGVKRMIKGVEGSRIVNSISKKAGMTLLHLAAARGNTDIVSELLMGGAKVNPISNEIEVNGLHKDLIGVTITPLLLAVCFGHLGVVMLLLKFNANPNLTKVSPLTMAAKLGYSDMLRELALQGLDTRDAEQWLNHEKKAISMQLEDLTRRLQEDFTQCWNYLKPGMYGMLNRFFASAKPLMDCQAFSKEELALKELVSMSEPLPAPVTPQLSFVGGDPRRVGVPRILMYTQQLPGNNTSSDLRSIEYCPK